MATMSTIWDRAAEFLSDHLRTVLPIALLALFAPLALLGVLMPLIGVIGQADSTAIGLIALALSIVAVWGHLALTALALDPAGGRGPATALATRRLLPLIGISLLVLLGIMLLSIPFGVALGLSGIDMTAVAAGRTPATAPNIGPLIFFLLYLPVFMLLLLWCSARLLVLTPTIVAERRGLGIFRRLFALTRPVQWKLFGVLLLYIVVSSVASSAARTVFGTVFGLLIGGEGTLTTAGVLTSIVVAGVSTVFSVLYIAFVARLYLALRDARGAVEDGPVEGGAVEDGAVRDL